MGLTEQNPATKDGNGVKVWGEPPRRHPGTDGVADATNPEVDAQYDDGHGQAAPAGKLAGPSHVVSEGVSRQSSQSSTSSTSSGTSETKTAAQNKEARRG